MMKRQSFRTIWFLTAIIALSACSSEVNAQEWKRHDVAFVYGFGSYANDRDFWDRDAYKNSGVFSAQYVFNITKRFGVGAVFGYEHFAAISRFDNSADDFSAMFVIRANWITKPDFTLYSKAGVGRYFRNGKTNYRIGEFNYRKSNDKTTALIIPSIGATFSLGKGFFGLSEFSLYSSQGMLLFGVGYRF